MTLSVSMQLREINSKGGNVASKEKKDFFIIVSKRHLAEENVIFLKDFFFGTPEQVSVKNAFLQCKAPNLHLQGETKCAEIKNSSKIVTSAIVSLVAWDREVLDVFSLFFVVLKFSNVLGRFHYLQE